MPTTVLLGLADHFGSSRPIVVKPPSAGHISLKVGRPVVIYVDRRDALLHEKARPDV